MNSLEWGPCGRAPPPHLDHGSDRLLSLTPPHAADPNPGVAAHGTNPGNATASYGQGPQAPAFTAAQSEAGADLNGGVLVPSQSKKRRRRAPGVGKPQQDELLPAPTTAAVMTMSPHLVDWYSASLRQGAEYYMQGVRLLFETNAFDLRRAAAIKYVWTDVRRGECARGNVALHIG
jgi:hypothetical protein